MAKEFGDERGPMQYCRTALILHRSLYDVCTKTESDGGVFEVYLMARPREFDEDSAPDAAMECIWYPGYEATTVRDLAVSNHGPSL